MTFFPRHRFKSFTPSNLCASSKEPAELKHVSYICSKGWLAIYIHGRRQPAAGSPSSRDRVQSRTIDEPRHGARRVGLPPVLEVRRVGAAHAAAVELLADEGAARRVVQRVRRVHYPAAPVHVARRAARLGLGMQLLVRPTDGGFLPSRGGGASGQEDGGHQEQAPPLHPSVTGGYWLQRCNWSGGARGLRSWEWTEAREALRSSLYLSYQLNFIKFNRVAKKISDNICFSKQT